MKQTLFVLTIATCVLAAAGASAQTTLTAGDIAVIGINTDNPDSFTFVTLIDLQAGTEIKFTDSGVLSTGLFRPNEGAVMYTAPSAIGAGTVIQFTGIAGDWTSANDAGVGTSGLNLSTSGDQIIVFQGASTTPTFIYAAQTNSTAWQADATSSNTSSLPPGLVDGTTAVAVGAGSGAGDENDNAQFTGSRDGADKATVLAEVSNAGNWVGSGSALTLDTTPFGNVPVELMTFSVE